MSRCPVLLPFRIRQLKMLVQYVVQSFLRTYVDDFSLSFSTHNEALSVTEAFSNLSGPYHHGFCDHRVCVPILSLCDCGNTVAISSIKRL